MTTEDNSHRHHRHHRGGWGPLWLIFWPFILGWRLFSFILRTVGRLVTGIIGFALLVVGIVVSLTVVGAIVGVPLALVGFLLILRAIF